MESDITTPVELEVFSAPDRSKTDLKQTRGSGRVLRNRRYKRPFEDRRPVKRLFTPEIKRYLKGWLIRRRENPYPSRDEKKQLALQTGLTYIQICNWFANWRRKLKNAGKEVDKFTWSTLIKSYNNQAMGNVEQFSISSDDSIWEEPEALRLEERTKEAARYPLDHCYTTLQFCQQKKDEVPAVPLPKIEPLMPQCFQISSTTDFIRPPPKLLFHAASNKQRKNSRDRNGNYRRKEAGAEAGALSRWRRSVACFTPRHRTYAAACVRDKVKRMSRSADCLHGREELDAAEALTFLSRASTNKSV